MSDIRRLSGEGRNRRLPQGKRRTCEGGTRATEGDEARSEGPPLTYRPGKSDVGSSTWTGRSGDRSRSHSRRCFGSLPKYSADRARRRRRSAPPPHPLEGSLATAPRITPPPL